MPTKRNASSLKVAPSAHSADLAALCAVLAASGSEPDQVPPGWHTKRELVKATGRGRSQVVALLTRAVAAGKMETRIFRVLNAVGAAMPKPHYRVKK